MHGFCAPKDAKRFSPKQKTPLHPRGKKPGHRTANWTRRWKGGERHGISPSIKQRAANRTPRPHDLAKAPSQAARGGPAEKRKI